MHKGNKIDHSSGGLMQGYIAPGGPWCTGESKPAVIAGQEEQSAGKGNTSVKIYPNPTTGIFFLELQGKVQTEKVRVDVTGLLGENVMT